VRRNFIKAAPVALPVRFLKKSAAGFDHSGLLRECRGDPLIPGDAIFFR
jgi:hypothetical protein